MLKRLRVRNFKSLADVTVEFPRMAVLFGPNAAGKSNLLDAIQALSRIGTKRTLTEALEYAGMRGHAFEQFAEGTSGFHSGKPESQFSIQADVGVPNGANRMEHYRYSVDVGISYRSGTLANRGEHLSALTKSGRPRGEPAIETAEGQIAIRRQSGGGHSRHEKVGQHHTVLSDGRFAAPAHKFIERVRNELQDWEAYYLDPRVAMRAKMPLMDVTGIGPYGQFIAPFFYKLKGEQPEYYQSIRRTVRTIIPEVPDFDVDLVSDGTLDFSIRQNGIPYSCRIVSEGTLRVLGLCAISANPWSASLLAVEEPENGVHPRRVELLAKMLTRLALDHGRQVVITTHSPLLCDAVLAEARDRDTSDIGLFHVRRDGPWTAVQRFRPRGPIFDDPEVAEALRMPAEGRQFQSLTMRGFFDD